MASRVEKLLLMNPEQREIVALRERIDALELSLRTAAHEREVLQNEVLSLQMRLLDQRAADPDFSARQEEGLRQIRNELLEMLEESVLTEARREFYLRHILLLDTNNLVVLLRNMKFADSMQ